MRDDLRFRASPEDFRLRQRSIKDPEGFWAEVAEKSADDIRWFKRWERVFVWENARFKWFVGGLTNAGYNCADNKLRHGKKLAYIYKNPERGYPKRSRTIGSSIQKILGGSQGEWESVK